MCPSFYSFRCEVVDVEKCSWWFWIQLDCCSCPPPTVNTSMRLALIITLRNREGARTTQGRSDRSRSTRGLRSSNNSSSTCLLRAARPWGNSACPSGYTSSPPRSARCRQSRSSRTWWSGRRHFRASVRRLSRLAPWRWWRTSRRPDRRAAATSWSRRGFVRVEHQEGCIGLQPPYLSMLGSASSSCVRPLPMPLRYDFCRWQNQYA